MKKFLFALPLFFTGFIIIACCKKPKKCHNCGVVIAKNYFYIPDSGKYINSQINSPDTKMWFKDSMAIIETYAAVIDIDYKGHETRKMVLSSYTFVDLKNEWYYQYHSFTDTATLVIQFTPHNADSVQVNTIMWTFFNRGINEVSESEMAIEDTIIDKVNYKRKQFIYPIYTKDEIWKETGIAYYRCDKTGTLFTYGDDYSKQVKCPMVKVEFLQSPLHKSMGTLSEIVYDRNELTAEELKVFDAWEANEKKHPMK